MSVETIAVDYVRVFSEPNARSKVLATRLWGDPVDVIERTGSYLRIKIRSGRKDRASAAPEELIGYLVARDGVKVDDITTRDPSRVLAVSFVDVQQGDGTVIVTPAGKVMVIDGGDNQLFARYLAARFPGTTEESPLPVEAIVVTHGDADHFSGLAVAARTETDAALEAQPWKRVFLQPKRVFHNGIVKRPSTQDGAKVPERESLGPVVEKAGKTYLTGLVDDLLTHPAAEMNQPFKAWRRALQQWAKRAEIVVRRLAKGDGSVLEEFLAEENIRVEVLGPNVERVGGEPALRFLGIPPKERRVDSEDEDQFKGLSASHTINGHSIILRMKYGGYHFLFAGDLNEQAEVVLTKAHKQGKLSLEAEVLKVPHHGSADFSPEFLRAVAPVVSIISSGDENERKEYVHPRATLVGALGKCSRVEEPVVLVTELVAFFETQGYVYPAKEEDLPPDAKKDRYNGTEPFYAFRRSNYGLVEVRTDGTRMVVLTHSGKEDLKEAYAFRLDRNGKPERGSVRKA